MSSVSYLPVSAISRLPSRPPSFLAIVSQSASSVRQRASATGPADAGGSVVMRVLLVSSACRGLAPAFSGVVLADERRCCRECDECQARGRGAHLVTARLVALPGFCR